VRLFAAALLGLSSFAVAQSPRVGACPVLPADSIWNTRIDQLPVHPSSSTWVATIGASAPVHPDFGAGIWNGAPIGIPFVTVAGTQTKYPATFLYQSESDPGPYAVPLTAPIEGGSASTGDRHATAIDTTNCILYEIYNSFPQSASWKGDSGAIFNLNSNALRPATWTSADAAGLPIFPGLLRYEEVAAGAIRHAIRFTVPRTQKAYVWPARHYASSQTGAQYPPMGARFRLSAGFDISGYSATNQIILTALKNYGMILADNGSAWYLSGAPDPGWNDSDLHNLTKIAGISFEAVDVSPLMIDPNSGQARQTSVTVGVTPASASVAVNQTKQFSAAVTGSTNTSVTWDVNGAVGGNASVGFIDSITGLYTSPLTAPVPATVTVNATSNGTAGAKGSALVTITNPAPPPPPPAVTVSISPSRASVRISTTAQFTATVKNAADGSVRWEVNGVAGGTTAIGTIITGGLYKAPSSVPPSFVRITVRAVSVADPTKSASATVTVTRR
jgi:hypothetical protein